MMPFAVNTSPRPPQPLSGGLGSFNPVASHLRDSTDKRPQQAWLLTPLGLILNQPSALQCVGGGGSCKRPGEERVLHSNEAGRGEACDRSEEHYSTGRVRLTRRPHITLCRVFSDQHGVPRPSGFVA